MRKIYFLVLVSSLVIVHAVQAQQTANIELRGPDTLILFGQKVNQLYLHQQPQSTIRIRGGGAEAAVSQLLKGQIDIAQSHGELRADLTKGLLPIPIGVEAIVIYVNASNPVSELSVAQVHRIYTGEILNWKQLGGPDRRIAIYGGESTSSMNPYFAEAVLRGDTSFSYMGKPSTKELLDAVASHPDAIGFAGLGFSANTKALRIRASGSKAIEPTFDNVRSLDYPIARYIYWYLPHQPREAVKEFCEWMLSSQGQLVVEGVGFQPLPLDKRFMARQRLGLPAVATSSGN
ncbi:MAG TPA: substrate-binding domain-containing protein [Candidatus Angelobacter sp.]